MKEILRENLAIDQITGKIIGCAYELSNTPGSGFPESVYEKALHHQAIKMGLIAERQFQMKVHYDDVLVGEFFADLLIEERVIVEIKAVRELDELHVAQAMNYLKARRFVPYDVWKGNSHRMVHRRPG